MTQLSRTLARGRARAEALMTATVALEHITDEGTLNQTTAEYEPTWTAVYTGKAMIQLRDTLATLPDGGERVATVVRTIVSLPIAAPVGDPAYRVRVIAEPSDPEIVGNVYRVRSVASKSHATARRYECEEAQA